MNNKEKVKKFEESGKKYSISKQFAQSHNKGRLVIAIIVALIILILILYSMKINNFFGKLI